MSAVKWNSLFFVFLLASVGDAQNRLPFIINGAETDAFQAVGIVGEESVGGFCTGTLISPSHVLTAAHCAEAILDNGSLSTGIFQINGRVYRTASVEIISSYNNRTFVDDVAILVLSEPVEGVEPAELSLVSPEMGEVVTLVGFGGQGTAEEGSDGSFGTKLVGTVTVDNVTATEFSWIYDDANESNSAPGDSGGPIFIDTSDGYLLAGIVSSGTQSGAGIGDTSFNMRVDAYSGWISETVIETQAILDEIPAAEEQGDEQDGEQAEEPDAEPANEEAPAEPQSESPTEETPVAEESEQTTCNSHAGGNRRRGHGNRRRGNHDQSCHTTLKPGCASDDSADDSTLEESAVPEEAVDVTSDEVAVAAPETEVSQQRRRPSANRRRNNPRRSGSSRAGYRLSGR